MDAVTLEAWAAACCSRPGGKHPSPSCPSPEASVVPHRPPSFQCTASPDLQHEPIALQTKETVLRAGPMAPTAQRGSGPTTLSTEVHINIDEGCGRGLEAEPK